MRHRGSRAQQPFSPVGTLGFSGVNVWPGSPGWLASQASR